MAENERYNMARMTKLIYKSKIVFFKLKTLRDILEIKKEGTLFTVIKRLIDENVLTRVERNKYLLKDTDISDFSLANFLYQPSYISFESALNFYGILSQFPYEISSATPKKTNQKRFEGKIFTYTQIKKDLFWGYEKRDNFLIALPEKALLDQLYLVAKGQKNINLDELNLENISIIRLKRFVKKYPLTRQFKNMLDKAESYFKL